MTPPAMDTVKRRNTRPCEACRKRKTACHREPSAAKCVGCELRKLECIVLPRRDKRDLLKVKPPTAIKKRIRPFLEVVSGNPFEEVTVDQEADSPNEPLQPLFEQTGLDCKGTHKSVFAGFSGDFDPWLIETQLGNSIDFPRQGSYSSVQAVSSNVGPPAYFFLFPKQFLDTRPGEYNIDAIQQLIKPHSTLLLETYFRVIHPIYPIFSVRRFGAQCRQNHMTATLLSSIYVCASPYLSTFAGYAKQTSDILILSDFIAKAVPLEARAATLQTVQAGLLFLQVPPQIIREPNFPGHWIITATVLAESQEIGLNLDPTTWIIPEWEKRERKKTWWAVYIQDKWESLGLSRPSHISDDDSTVPMLVESDFEEPEEFPVVVGLRCDASRYCFWFISLCKLSLVLSDVLKDSFSVKKSFQQNSSPQVKHAKAIEYRERIDKACIFEFSPDIGSCGLSFMVAKWTLILSFLRSVLHSGDVAECYYLIKSMAFDTISEVILYLQKASLASISGPWWSYSRVNFAVIGSALLAFHSAGKKLHDTEFNWRSLVEEYHNILVNYSKMTPVTKLAVLRYENLVSMTRALDSVIETTTRTQEMTERTEKSLDIFQYESDQNYMFPIEDDSKIFLDWLSQSYGREI